MRGILKTMTSTAKEVIGAGENLFHIVADGTIMLTNETVRTVTGLGGRSSRNFRHIWGDFKFCSVHFKFFGNRIFEL